MLIIIFCAINLMMWCIVIEYMKRWKTAELELRKRTEECEKKAMNYYHASFQHFVEMSETNIQAMEEFLTDLRAGKVLK